MSIINRILKRRRNALATKFGFPARGLISLIVPGWDVKGRNILPVGSDNFVTGWSNGTGETCTVTDYPVNIPGIGDVIAKRITGNGLGSDTIKRNAIVAGRPNPHTDTISVWGMVLSGNAKLASYSLNSISLTSTMQRLQSTRPNWANTATILSFITNAPTDILDIVVYAPKIEIGATATASSPPLGLPQNFYDFSGKSNSFTLGATTAVGADDPTLSASGVTFGVDDYLKSSSSVFDDMAQFTCVTALVETKTAAFQRIFSKADGANVNGPLLYVDTAGAVKFEYSTTGETNTARWTIGVLTDAAPTIVGLIAKKQLGATAVSGFLNATKQTMVYAEGGTPASAVAYSDALNDLFVGNRSSANRALNGSIYAQAWYNVVQSDSEYQQSYRAMKRLCAAMGVTIA